MLYIKETFMPVWAPMSMKIGHEKKVDVCIAHGSFDKPPKFEIRVRKAVTA
jgi:hypothetical protein